MLIKNRLIHKYTHGFTIVELLIVIVIIGILATLAVVTYSGIQKRNLNILRYQEAKQWQKIISMYSQQYGTSLLPTGNHCLGVGFPDMRNNDGIGDCWDASGGSSIAQESPSLNSEWRKIVTTFPNNTREAILGSNGTTYRLGPVVTISSTPAIYIQYWLEAAPGQCPEGDEIWHDAGKTISCRLEIALN